MGRGGLFWVMTWNRIGSLVPGRVLNLSVKVTYYICCAIWTPPPFFFFHVCGKFVWFQSQYLNKNEEISYFDPFSSEFGKIYCFDTPFGPLYEFESAGGAEHQFDFN